MLNICVLEVECYGYFTIFTYMMYSRNEYNCQWHLAACRCFFLFLFRYSFNTSSSKQIKHYLFHHVRIINIIIVFHNCLSSSFFLVPEKKIHAKNVGLCNDQSLVILLCTAILFWFSWTLNVIYVNFCMMVVLLELCHKLFNRGEKKSKKESHIY